MTPGPRTPREHAEQARGLVWAADPRGWGWRTAFLRALCALVHAVLATVPPPPEVELAQLEERVRRLRDGGR